LFSALKVPKAYLGYDESLSSKATLAQEDIRFSRTITKIQKVVISELNKIAAIHLFANGFADEDLIDFEIRLSNPSTIAQQQKLELFRSKFEIAAQAPEGVLSRDYVRKQIIGLTSEQIEKIEIEKDEDKLRDLEIESITLQAPEGAPAPEGEAEEVGAEEEEAEGEGGLEVSGDSPDDENLILGVPTMQTPEQKDKNQSTKTGTPVKASSKVKVTKPRRSRGGDGRIDPVRPPGSTSYTTPRQERYVNNKTFDREIVKGSDLRLEEQEKYQNNLTATLKKTLKNLENEIGNSRTKSTLITEGEDFTDGEA
jgi:hypothetical protein